MNELYLIEQRLQRIEERLKNVQDKLVLIELNTMRKQ